MKKICTTKVWHLLFLICISITCTNFSSKAESYNKRVGESFILPVPKSPVNNSYLNSWSYSCTSSNVDIINSDGIGTVTIVNYFEGSVTIECYVSYTIVYDNGNMHAGTTYEYHTLKCEGNNISISAPYPTLAIGESMQLSYSFAHSTYDIIPNIKWESNSNAIQIDQSGYVTAISEGEATIYATSNMGPNVAECHISVKKIDPTSVSIPSSIILTAGESKTLTPKLTPYNAHTTFTWTSTNPEVALVSQAGNVIAKKHGHSDITVQTTNGLTSSCSVTVNKAQLSISSSLEDGLYTDGELLELNSSYDGANIYYTLDGSIPSTNSNKYVNPIELKHSVVVKAIAIHSDYNPSEILTLNLDVTKLATLNFSLQNGDSQVSDFNKPFIEFNIPLDAEFDISKINLIIDGKPVEFNASIYGSILCISPNSSDYFGSHNCKLIIPAYSVHSIDGDPNTPMTFSWSTSQHDMIDIRRPIYAYANEGSSLYITSDNVLHYFGKLTFGIVDSNAMHEFPDAVKGVCGGSFVAYIDTEHNLWIAGHPRLLNDFGKSRYLYATNVKDISYGNGTLFYVTDEESLYGVGSDWGNALQGKSSKKDKYGVGYSEIPIHLGNNVSAVYAGSQVTLVLLNTGLLGGWGTALDENKPLIAIDNDVKMASVSSGSDSDGLPIYLKHDGTAWYLTSNFEPKKIADNVKTLDGKSNRGYYIDNDGILYGFGSNKSLRLGDYYTYDNSNGDFFTDKNMSRLVNPENAVRIKEDCYGNARYTSVSLAGKYAMALATNGDIYAWGSITLNNDIDRSSCSNLAENSTGDDILCVYPTLIVETLRNPELEDIDLPNEMIIICGKEYIIPSKTIPINATFSTFEWYSSDEETVHIGDNGVLQAKKEGDCAVTVTITTSDGLVIERTVKIHVVSEQSSGIADNSAANKDLSFDIYSLQGLLMKRNATPEDLPALPHGIYIKRQGKRSEKIMIR